MRLLDLFCGAGGAAMGYARAGFDVVGIDIENQPRYPFDFGVGDALTMLRTPAMLEPFDVIHASPPCQRWMGVPGALREEAYPDLLTPTLELLAKQERPYVVENIPTAPFDGFILCGATFGLPVVRHRRFQVRPWRDLVPTACPARSFARSTGHGAGFYPYAHGAWRPAWREHVMPEVWPWMTIEDTHEAIPPAYTEYIGGFLQAALRAEA